MKKFSTKAKVAAALGAGAVAVAGSGVAFAFWTSTGGGSGSASTGTTTDGSLGVTDDSGKLTAMYPGDRPQTVTGTVTNNESSASIFVKSVTVDLSTDSATPGDGQVNDKPQGCDVTNYSLDNGTVVAPVVDGGTGKVTTAASNKETVNLGTGGAGIELLAGHSTTFTYTIQFNDKSDTNQDLCKGTGVTMTYTANGS